MLVIKAIQFASKKHFGQERKGSGLPYITHPIIVAHLLAKFKQSKRLEELMAAAVLHDTLEDTDTNFVELATEFTPFVAGLVLELTSDEKEIKKIGKNEYMKIHLCGMSSYALTLKLADRLSNVMDEPSEKYKVDTLDLIDHISNNRKLSGTQMKMVQEIQKVIHEK